MKNVVICLISHTGKHSKLIIFISLINVNLCNNNIKTKDTTNINIKAL